MACSRCGARKPVRPADMPSSVIRSQKPKVVPTPMPSYVSSDPKAAITGLKYVPSN